LRRSLLPLAALSLPLLGAFLPRTVAAAETPIVGQEIAEEAPPATSGSAGVGPASPNAPVASVAPVDDAEPSWAQPTIEVRGAPVHGLREERAIGDYGQPRWTATRRFPTTRMYVIPRGKVEAEYWMRFTAPFEHVGAEREIRSYYELGMGIGHRLQLDVYMVTQQEGQGPIALERQMFELRYALADWGKLWGNPTLYVEYQLRNGANDWLEGKLLLGGEVAPRVHGALNFVLERELGGRQEDEWNVTGGLSYSLVDSLLHVGAEGYVEVHDVKGDRFSFKGREQLYLAGPSLMISPIRPFHLLFAPLFGAGKEEGGGDVKGRFRLWFVSSWAF
jgi:hypothetical protein